MMEGVDANGGEGPCWAVRNSTVANKNTRHGCENYSYSHHLLLRRLASLCA